MFMSQTVFASRAFMMSRHPGTPVSELDELVQQRWLSGDPSFSFLVRCCRRLSSCACHVLLKKRKKLTHRAMSVLPRLPAEICLKPRHARRLRSCRVHVFFAIAIVCGEYINSPRRESMGATAFRLRNVTRECDISHILVHPVVMLWESGVALPAITVQAYGWFHLTVCM